MNKCPNCSVSVYQQKCPLCGFEFDLVTDTKNSYPMYVHKEKKKRNFVKRLYLFLAINTVLITSFINVFTYEKGDSLWALTVCVALIY
ncbi:MAG: hypothetical protein ACRCUS_00085, partial [Anaerovoracaceae bacterium]